MALSIQLNQYFYLIYALAQNELSPLFDSITTFMIIIIYCAFRQEERLTELNNKLSFKLIQKELIQK